MKYLYLSILACFSWSSLSAQKTMQVHPTANVTTFGSKSMAVFGDLKNEGVNRLEENAKIIFMGETWTNANTSISPGTGTVEFVQPSTLFGTSLEQQLDGGGEASSFPNVLLQNSNNLSLFGEDSHIREILDLQDGHILLNNPSLMVDTILNYTEDRFIVSPASTTGYLMRSLMAGNTVEYPVGRAVGDYTPARLSNAISSASDTFSVRVFGGTYTNASSGSSMNAITVGRTWMISERTNGGDSISLELQHNVATEGANFSPTEHFITRYFDTILAPSTNKWEKLDDSLCTANIFPADITTGAAVAGAALNQRAALTNFQDYTYYTVIDCDEIILATDLEWWEANLDDNCNALLTWQFSEQSDIFEIQIEQSPTGIDFESVATLAKSDANFYTYSIPSAEWLAPTTYFRLRLEDKQGVLSYSDIRVLDATACQRPNTYQIYPNPVVNGKVTVQFGQAFAKTLNAQFRLIDVLGRTVVELSQKIEVGDQLFEFDLGNLPTGSYILNLQNKEQAFIRNEKIIVQN